MKNMSEKIDTIIINYNREDSILRTIKSIQSQDIETNILVVDDGSTDRSIELIANNYPKVKIIKNRINLGRSCSRNIGIKNIKNNKDILFIDSDVFLGSNCLGKLIKELDKNDIVFPELFFANNIKFYPFSENDYKFPLEGSAFIVREGLIGQYNIKFDENLKYAEDKDFFINCYSKGLKSKVVEGAHAFYTENKKDGDANKYFQDVSAKFYLLKKWSKQELKKVPSSHNINKYFLIKSFLAGLLNYNYFYHQDLTINQKIKKFFGNYKRFNASRIELINLFLKASHENSNRNK